jgi:GNAT superfamily N-acetyltransferase
MNTDSRSSNRRPVYLGEGVTFGPFEAIDVSAEGMGLAVTSPGPVPEVGSEVRLGEQRAVVRHVGRMRTGTRILPRIGVSFVRDGAALGDFTCPDAMPAFATAWSPWFHREQVRMKVMFIGGRGMTVTPMPLLTGMELDFELHLPFAGVQTVRGVITDAGAVAWIEPSRAAQSAIARYLLAADDTLTPATLRAAGLRVGSVEREVSYGVAASAAEFDEVLALRLRAHQDIGHLEDVTVEDMRSSYDTHSRHLVCRFGGRVVGYVRVIFVDGVPARSQYVSMGGHEVPAWLWEAGFVEAGAGAIDPEFQNAGLFSPMMAHSLRVAVQSGHRYVLGACDDDLLGMYEAMGFEKLEERVCEPKPGWRFRSHLIVLDCRQIVESGPAAMAEAIRFAGLEPAVARLTSAVAA